MRIGPEHWHWVSIDTPGVPTGGKYGDARRFEQKIAPHGYKLAWKQQWECFVMYEVRANEEYVPHVTFLDWETMEPIPLRDEQIRVFLAMREEYANQPTIELAMKQHSAKMRFELEAEQQRLRDERKEALMRMNDLGLGLVTPRVTIQVP